MKFANPFDVEFWVLPEPEPTSHSSPECARANAAYAAQLVEENRATLRADLMRRLRENREERDRINDALDELDALRVLETAT